MAACERACRAHEAELAAAFHTIVSEYTEFVNAEPPQEVRAFAARHAAGKAAVVHLAALAKLLREGEDIAGNPETDEGDIASVLAAARAALAHHDHDES